MKGRVMRMSSQRNTFSPKRMFADSPPRSVLEQLCENVSYEGSPYHKKDPRRFRLPTPPQPRSDKSLCDEADVSIQSESDALALLKEGISRGMISQQQKNGFPKHIWAVLGGIPFEAILGNEVTGCYHGYPLRRDRFGQQVLEKWEASHV